LNNLSILENLTKKYLMDNYIVVTGFIIFCY